MFRRLFKRISKAIKNSGILGALFSFIIDEIFQDQKANGLPAHLEQKLDDWAKAVFDPIMENYFMNIDSNNPNYFSLAVFKGRFNDMLLRLSAGKIYYEARAKEPGNSNDETLLYGAKSEMYNGGIVALQETFKEATKGTSNPFRFSVIIFDPQQTIKLGGDRFNWRTISSEIYGWSQALEEDPDNFGKNGGIVSGGGSGAGTIISNNDNDGEIIDDTPTPTPPFNPNGGVILTPEESKKEKEKKRSVLGLLAIGAFAVLALINKK